LGGGEHGKTVNDFLVVTLKTQANTTKSTTPTLQNAPCITVYRLHTATVTKDLGNGAKLKFGGNCPLPQRKTAPGDTVTRHHDKSHMKIQSKFEQNKKSFAPVCG